MPSPEVGGAAAEAAAALSCPICLQLIDEPRMLTCCQQSFCRRCLHAALDLSPVCPLCCAAASMETALPNRVLESILVLARENAHGSQSVISAASQLVDSSEECALPLPAMQRRPRWTAGDPNPFIAPARSASWTMLLARAEEWLRCVAIIILVMFFMTFLKVQEEEFARQTGYWRGGTPRLSGPSVSAPNAQHGDVLTLPRAMPRSVAATTTDATIQPLLDATQLSGCLFSVVLLAAWLGKCLQRLGQCADPLAVRLRTFRFRCSRWISYAVSLQKEPDGRSSSEVTELEAGNRRRL